MADIAPDISTFESGNTPTLDISSFDFTEDKKKTTSGVPDISEMFPSHDPC